MFTPKRWYDFDPVIQEVIDRLIKTGPTYRSLTGNRMNHILLERYPFVFDRGHRILNTKSWNALCKRRDLTMEIWSNIELWQFLNEDQLMDVVIDTLQTLNDLEKEQWHFLTAHSTTPIYTIYPHQKAKRHPQRQDALI